MFRINQETGRKRYLSTVIEQIVEHNLKFRDKIGRRHATPKWKFQTIQGFFYRIRRRLFLKAIGGQRYDVELRITQRVFMLCEID